MRIPNKNFVTGWLIMVLVLLTLLSCGGNGATSGADDVKSSGATEATSVPSDGSTGPPTVSPASTPIPVVLPTLEEHESLRHGLAMSIPKGWVVDETQSSVLRIENPTGLAAIEIELSTFSAPLSRSQFDEYVSLKMLQLKDSHQGFTEIERELVSTPSGLLLKFSYIEQDDPMFAVVLYTFNSLRGATLLARTGAEFGDFFGDLFEASLKSVRLQPEPPGPLPTPLPTPTVGPTPVPTYTPGYYSNEELGFTMNIPSGWSMLAPAKNESVRFLGVGGFEVKVIGVHIPLTMSKDAYLITLKQSRYEPLKNYSLVSEDRRTIGARWADEIQFDALNDSDDTTNRHLSLVIREKARVFIIEVVGARSRFNEAEDGLHTLLDSFFVP